MKKIIFYFAVLFLPKSTFAHCPLCTVGAGALVVFSASIGISTMVTGVMLGGFAMALSSWIAKLPKKELIPFQYQILVVVVFALTVVPILPFAKDYTPLYLSIAGEYGNFLHKTYAINLFFVGSLVGAFLMILAPYISRKITKIRGGKTIAFQGITISLILLVLASVVVEIFL